MGVCTACSGEVADDQLTDSKCANCAGGGDAAPAVDAPVEAAAEDAPASEAPAEDAPAA